MKYKKNIFFIFTLIYVILITSFNPFATAQAAAKIKLNKSSLTLEAGKTAKLKLKNVAKKSASKIKWSSTSKKIASVKAEKKNKATAVVTANKEGKATVKAKLLKKTYSCKVKVNSPDNTSQKPEPTAQIIYVMVISVNRYRKDCNYSFF